MTHIEDTYNNVLAAKHERAEELKLDPHKYDYLHQEDFDGWKFSPDCLCDFCNAYRAGSNDMLSKMYEAEPPVPQIATLDLIDRAEIVARLRSTEAFIARSEHAFDNMFEQAGLSMLGFATFELRSMKGAIDDILKRHEDITPPIMGELPKQE